jgi:hypothetical protein
VSYNALTQKQQDDQVELLRIREMIESNIRLCEFQIEQMAPHEPRVVPIPEFDNVIEGYWDFPRWMKRLARLVKGN